VSASVTRTDRAATGTHDGWSMPAIGLTVVTLFLLLVGLLMSFSASIVDAAQEGDAFGIFRRQAMWAAIGLPVYLLATRVPRHVLRALAWPGIALAAVALVLVLIPGIGVTRFGSTRWLGFGGLVVQPSEVAKLVLLVWLADVLERKRPADGGLHTTSHLLVPALPALLVLGLLVLLQPDLGTTVILAVIVGAVLWVEGIRLRIFALAAGAATLAGGLLALVAPYRLARVRGWLWPERYPLDEGFQLLQSWVALGSGGVFGLGLGSSRGKWNFIPNPETDFVFAIIGEELGLVGAGTIVVLFLAVLLVGLHIAYNAAAGFDRTVAFAITTWIVGQAMLNIATVIGLLPITGVTLPLVSAGGSSLVVTMAALGVVANVARFPSVQEAPRASRRPPRRRG
jgi:cell division protein FtsW